MEHKNLTITESVQFGVEVTGIATPTMRASVQNKRNGRAIGNGIGDTMRTTRSTIKPKYTATIHTVTSPLPTRSTPVHLGPEPHYVCFGQFDQFGHFVTRAARSQVLGLGSQYNSITLFADVK